MSSKIAASEQTGSLKESRRCAPGRSICFFKLSSALPAPSHTACPVLSDNSSKGYHNTFLWIVIYDKYITLLEEGLHRQIKKAEHSFGVFLVPLLNTTPGYYLLVCLALWTHGKFPFSFFKRIQLQF